MSGTPEIARANGKKGGRPKGKRSQRTLEREATLKVFRDRVMRHADYLFDAQYSIATGQLFLFRIDKEYVKTGKGGFYKNKKPILVTNVEEVRMYLENLVEKGDVEDDQDPASSYYYITTKEPDNDAIDSLLDRTFGKSKQGELDVNLKLPKPILDNVLGNNGNKKNSKPK
jgi:hypothetical protein